MPPLDRPTDFLWGHALAGLRTKLLNWFARRRRDLPWRASRDPYRIWVSEVMLQQTTVAMALPYYERFLAAFPTVEALAAADEQRVLKAWEGLGYYRRARHLHAAAKTLADTHGGKLPDDPEVWAELPGVGRYIMGAVLSQAFDRRLPIVEANTLRVLARLFGYRGDPREGEGRAWVWSAAETLLPQRKVGEFNQAMMELGALVCLPSNPRCDECPVAANCQAMAFGLQDQIPPPKKQPVVTAVNEVGVAVRDGSRVLLCRRPADAGRWPNMWEAPHAPIGENEDLSSAAVRITRELTGLEVEPGAEATTIRHAITRYRVTLVCMEAALRGGQFTPGFYVAADWVSWAELDKHPVSSPQRKLMTELSRRSRQKRLF